MNPLGPNGLTPPRMHYAAPDLGHETGGEQDSSYLPFSPAASAYTNSSPPLPVSTGLFQPETPPCEVSTPYQEAMYLKEQASVIRQEDEWWLIRRSIQEYSGPSNPDFQRTIQECSVSADRFAWTKMLDSSFDGLGAARQRRLPPLRRYCTFWNPPAARTWRTPSTRRRLYLY